MKKTYYNLKRQDPVMFECFFAFSNEQFAEGKAKMIPEGKTIKRGPHGLFGTQEGIAKLFADYDAIDAQIASECDPQDVYDYEFDNHECSYTCDDREAFAIVESIFGNERSATVKRKYAYI